MQSTEPMLLRALRREPVERPPVWLMRQAGRYMAEYREVRKDVDFLTLCHDAALAAKVTLDAVRVLDVDAAILFSDILVPAEAMGAQVVFSEKGPGIQNPVRSAADVDRLRTPDPARDLPFVAETIQRVREGLPADKALIGFAGAPFTVASYLIEGGGTRDFVRTKALMLRQPELFQRLLARIADATAVCLRAQVEAGCQAVQLFDSWAGFLAPRDYRDFALPAAQAVFAGLKDTRVPTILYLNGSPGLLELMAASGADCISVDWRVELDQAWQRIGHDKAIQGNLDPIVLHAGADVIRARTRDVLERAGGQPGHVFNLGHGIQKDTPVANVLAMIDEVKRFRAPPPVPVIPNVRM